MNWQDLASDGLFCTHYKMCSFMVDQFSSKKHSVGKLALKQDKKT